MLDDPNVSTVHELRLQMKIAEAYMGRVAMNIATPASAANVPHPELKWGLFNPRPINDTAAKKLLKSFQEKGISSWDHPISIGVKPEWVNPKCLTTSDAVPYVSLHTIEWTDAADGCQVQMYGGTHRAHALRLYTATFQKELISMQRRYDNLTAGKSRAKTEQEIATLAEEIDKTKESIERHGYWHVKVYNLSA